MREIPLAGGSVALVSDEDYEKVSEYKWHKSKDGYVSTTIRIFMHRLVLPVPDGMVADHIDGNPTNNCRENLRIATRSQNNWNQRPYSIPKTSKYKGVFYDKVLKKWRASIRCHGKREYLGSYASEDKAALAYDTRAKVLFGEFAWLNFKA